MVPVLGPLAALACGGGGRQGWKLTDGIETTSSVNGIFVVTH